MKIAQNYRDYDRKDIEDIILCYSFGFQSTCLFHRMAKKIQVALQINPIYQTHGWNTHRE